MRFTRGLAALALAGLVSSPLAAVTRRMFISSVAGTGNLSTWADAGGYTGLAAADAICQARATAAALPNAIGYRAWLSDSADDAYCRMHNLTGKRATNCGQATLPASAGPWWRTDGKPFGAGLPALLAPLEQVLHPPLIDEFGSNLHVAGAWTGTNLEGTAGPQTCANWTSAAPGNPVIDGYADLTSGGWTYAGTTECLASNRLYCFETGSGDPLPTFPLWGRLAFVTSAEGTGDLQSWPAAGGATGLAAGDTICQNLATAAGLRQPAAFKAWLSTSAANAIGRLEQDGAWMRPDGIVVARSKQDLTDGFLDSPLNQTETGAYVGGNAIWTGTQMDGFAAAANCSEWSSTTGTGEYGLANNVLVAWTSSGALTCGFAYASLYCLQDLPLIFLDGFESQGLLAWSVTVP